MNEEKMKKKKLKGLKKIGLGMKTEIKKKLTEK